MSNRVLSQLIEEYNIEFTGVIHLGAYNLEELPIYTEQNKDMPILWVEANPEKWQGIQATLKDYPNQHLFEGAICDVDDQEMSFKIYNHKEASSLFHPGTDLSVWYPEHQVQSEILVRTITLDTLLHRLYSTEYPIFNFLNMDIQGAELLALRGAKNLLSKLKHVEYIYTECTKATFYEGNFSDLNEIKKELLQYNYELVHLDKSVHKATYPHIQRLIDTGDYPEVAQYDVLFRRKS